MKESQILSFTIKGIVTNNRKSIINIELYKEQEESHLGTTTAINYSVYSTYAGIKKTISGLISSYYLVRRQQYYEYCNRSISIVSSFFLLCILLILS